MATFFQTVQKPGMNQHMTMPLQSLGTTAGFIRMILVAIGVTATAGSCLIAQDAPIVVKSITGSQWQGSFGGIDFEALTFQAVDGQRKVDFEQIAKVDFGVGVSVPEDPVVLVQLVDGSRLNCKTIAIDSGKISTELHCGSMQEFDSRNVESIRFKTYGDNPELGKQWREILEDQSREGDAIVVNRSKQLDTVEGVVGDLLDGKLGFSIDDRTARVSLEKMDAILLYHATGREFASPVCEILLIDGSIILARSIRAENSRFELTTGSGSRFEFPVDDLSKLDFQFGRDALLSEIQPTTNDWKPLLTSAAIFEQLRKMKLARVNQSYSGRPLGLNFSSESGLSFLAKTRQFESGFAMQGGGRLAFSLNGQYQRLTGWVGFDPEASSSGNVLFKVLLDGKIVLEKHLIRQKLRNPLELDLDIKDANRIVFQVEYQDGRSTGDQLHLVDLRVSQ